MKACIAPLICNYLLFYNWFMKYLISLLLIFPGLFATSQKVSLSGYGVLNQFYNKPFTNDKLSAEYQEGIGQCYELSLTGLGDFKLLPSFSLMVEHYKGNILYGYHDAYGGYTMDLDVNKTMLGIGVYPINFRVYKKIHFRAGTDFTFPLTDKTQIISDYKFEQFAWIDTTDGADLSPDLIIGLSATVDYRFNLGKRWYFAPRYRFYYGLMPELEDIRIKVKSVRHQLGISFGIK